MKISELKDLIDEGREIEFTYNGNRFSITYGSIGGEDVISFCKFYGESTEEKTFEELLEVCTDGYSLKTMLGEITEEDIWIF